MTALSIKGLVPNGDCALLLTFAASENRLAAIHALSASLVTKPLPQQLNVVPASDSLLLAFACPLQQLSNIEALVAARVAQPQVSEYAPSDHVIPVCYHADVAPDLHAVCHRLGVDVEQLIGWHVTPEYQVNMLGFLPGFAYLADNHPALNLPRKTSPSIQVPAGSVAVAGQQTGLYALSSPGGWHVIGRTPMTLLDWQRSEPAVLKPLDRIRFEAISLAEFQALEALA